MKKDKDIGFTFMSIFIVSVLLFSAIGLNIILRKQYIQTNTIVNNINKQKLDTVIIDDSLLIMNNTIEVKLDDQNKTLDTLILIPFHPIYEHSQIKNL